MIFNYFKPRKEDIIATSLYHKTVQQSRNPLLYQKTNIADCLENRFEWICLHAAFILQILNRDMKNTLHIKQAFIDRFVHDMDANLRELGIGDTKIAKNVRQCTHILKQRYQTYQNWPNYTQQQHHNILTETFFTKQNITKQNLHALSHYIQQTQQHICQLNPIIPVSELKKKERLLFLEPSLFF